MRRDNQFENINNIQIYESNSLLLLCILLQSIRLLLRLQDLGHQFCVVAMTFLSSGFLLLLVLKASLFRNDLRVPVLGLVLKKLFVGQLLNVISFLPLELNLLTGDYLHLVFADHLSRHMYLWLILHSLALHMLPGNGLELFFSLAFSSVVGRLIFLFETADRSIVFRFDGKFVIGGFSGTAYHARIYFGVMVLVDVSSSTISVVLSFGLKV